MPRYQCVDPLCKLYEEEITIAKVKLVYNKSRDKMEPSIPILCEECGSELQFIPNEGMPIIHFNKFDSLTAQDKRALIHKRSQDHFKKTDKGDLANYKKTITNDIRKRAEGRL